MISWCNTLWRKGCTMSKCRWSNEVARILKESQRFALLLQKVDIFKLILNLTRRKAIESLLEFLVWPQRLRKINRGCTKLILWILWTWNAYIFTLRGKGENEEIKDSYGLNLLFRLKGVLDMKIIDKEIILDQASSNFLHNLLSC